MLCLNCGKEIGDTIGLCDECAALNATEETHPTSSEEQTPTDEATAESQIDNEKKSEDTAKKAPVKKAKKSSNPSAKTTKAKKTKKVSSSLPKKKMLIGLGSVVGLVLVVALVGTLISPEYKGSESEVAENAPQDEEQDAAIEETKEPFPTSPHLVSGSISFGELRSTVKDAIFLFFPFHGRIEIGFYRESLAPGQKQRSLELTSLNDAAPDLQPFALFTIYTKPGISVCSKSAITHYTVRIASGGTNTSDFTKDFNDGFGGILDFSCQLKQGSPFSVELAQRISSQDDSVEYQWEVSASGPVYSAQITPVLRFTAANHWSLAVWNEEERSLTVGFFPRRLTADERIEIRRKRDLRAVRDIAPKFMLSFELLDGFTDFRREAVRSFGVHYIRDEINNGSGYFFPGESDIVSFYEIVSTEPSDTFGNISGHLFEAESVSASLKGSKEKEIDGQIARFEWDFKVSAPVIDVNSEPVSSVVFDPELAQIDRTVPDASGGTIEAGKASAKLVDTIALYYPAEGNLLIAFYTKPLSESERAQILAHNSIWQRRTGMLPNLVLSVDLKKGNASLMRSAIDSVRLTFVREPLGDFYFSGSLDRATVKLLGAELTNTELTHISGNVEDGANIALRFNGSHISEKTGLAFAWNLAVRTPVKVVK